MNHLKQIAAKLPEYGIDAMLVSSAPSEFYAVGLHGEGYAIITPNATRYITDGRYTEVAQETVGDAAEVLIVGDGRNYAALLNDFIAAHNIQKLGIEDDYMSLGQFNALTDSLKAELVYAGGLISSLRASKDEEELSRMVKAQEITDKAFDAIIQFIQPGMTEAEIAARLTYEMLRLGAQRMSFDPIVASGPNGSRPHAIPGPRQVQKGDFITMDTGAMLDGYHSDMTRTVALGKVSDEQRKVYETVLQAQLAVIDAVKPGILCCDVDKIARDIIEKDYPGTFGHGLGHGVGFEIHEWPAFSHRDQTPCAEGMVITDEPGIYVPAKYGVRIEDMLLVTADGCRSLTKSPKELIEL